MEAEASRLRRSSRELSSQLSSSPWRGPGAERFRAEFHSVHAKAMFDAAAFLDAAREALHANARQQRDASGVSGDVGFSFGLMLRRGMLAIESSVDDLTGRVIFDRRTEVAAKLW